MGTAFVAFHRKPREPQSHEIEKKLTLEIGRIVFRSIVEEMENERPGDSKWKGELDAAYGIKWLYVGVDREFSPVDFGPAFYWALQRLKVKGPPDYYPKRDLQLFYDQIDQLEKQYLSLRSLPKNLTPSA